MTSIGSEAFYGCKLEKVTLPDNIVYIGYYAFDNKKIYANGGSNTLLSLWAFNNNKDLYNNWSVFDISSGKELVRPSLDLVEATQTTLTLRIDNKYDEYGYSYGQSRYSNTGNLKVSGDCINITDLYPESDNTYYLYASINGGSEYRISDIVAKTANITPSINEQMITASSITAKGTYIEGDAIVSGL